MFDAIFFFLTIHCAGSDKLVLAEASIYNRFPSDLVLVFKSHWERKTDGRTNERTKGVTMSLLELLIAAKNLRNIGIYELLQQWL